MDQCSGFELWVWAFHRVHQLLFWHPGDVIAEVKTNIGLSNDRKTHVDALDRASAQLSSLSLSQLFISYIKSAVQPSSPVEPMPLSVFRPKYWYKSLLIFLFHLNIVEPKLHQRVECDINSIDIFIYVYVYIYVCVCVYVCLE